jgi:hypothetical protein
MNKLCLRKSSAQGISICAFLLLLILGLPMEAQPQPHLDCGPGEGWVQRCTPGVDVLRHSWIVLDLWLLNPDGSMGPNFPNLMLQGDTFVTRQAPTLDTSSGLFFIPTILSITVNGDLNGFGPITVQGNGTGRITEIGPNSALADSFFDVFVSLDLPGLPGLHSDGPIHLEADRPLIGVPPNEPPLSPLLVVPGPSICGPPDPLVRAICYSGDDEVNILTIDNIPVAIIHSEAHIVRPIPEPSTLLLLGSGLAGIAALGRRRLAKKG